MAAATTSSVPLKRNRETRSLLDSLGGGMEIPRSARRIGLGRLASYCSSSSSSVSEPSAALTSPMPLHPPPPPPTTAPSSQATPNLPHAPAIIRNRSDSSLSDISDFHDHPLHSTPPPRLTLSQPAPASAPLSETHSEPSPSNSTSMKKHAKKAKNCLRKTIVRRANPSPLGGLGQFGVPRKRNPHRARRLTEAEKRELEQTRHKLLEDLDEEERLIRSSHHPILLALEKNVDTGKELRLEQARRKFDRLRTYLDRLYFERQQRIWDTWTEKKIRMKSEMIVDCQIHLNRAPFEFLVSDDTTNLQAIFHLTPPPSKPYLAPIDTVSTSFSPPTTTNTSADLTASAPTHPRSLTIDPHDPDYHQTMDIIQGLARHRMRNHSLWKLSESDVMKDLESIREA